MKYKISLLFFLLLFVAYVLLSFLNADKVPLTSASGGLRRRSPTISPLLLCWA